MVVSGHDENELGKGVSSCRRLSCLAVFSCVQVGARPGGRCHLEPALVPQVQCLLLCSHAGGKRRSGWRAQA